MPYCGGNSKTKKITAQKVVIPKGIINPDETTVIEIPITLQKQPIVIAKRKVTEKPTNETPSRSNHRRAVNDSFGPTTSSNAQPQEGFLLNDMRYTNPVDLEAAEEQERERLNRSLQEYQKARRMFLLNASQLASTEDPNNCRRAR